MMEKYILAALFFLNISKIALSDQDKRILELVSIPTAHLNTDNSTNITVSCTFTCGVPFDEIPSIKLFGTYNLEGISGFELHTRKVFNDSGLQKDTDLCTSSGENVTVEVNGSVDRTLRDEECSFTTACSVFDSNELHVVVNDTFPYQDNLSAGDPCSGLVISPNLTKIITVVSTTTIAIHPMSSQLCISAILFSSLPSPTHYYMSSATIKIKDGISQSTYTSSHNDGSAMINNAKENREENDISSLQFYIILGVLSLCAILSLLLNVVLLMCLCKRRRNHTELNIIGIPNITYKNS